MNKTAIMEDLQRISDKQFANVHLNQVRDIFLFSCYTGLAFADVKKPIYEPHNIMLKFWIVKLVRICNY